MAAAVGSWRERARGAWSRMTGAPLARPVVTWVDAAYGPACCVMLESLYRHSRGTRFDTYVYTGAGGVDVEPFLSAFATLRRRYGRRIFVRRCDDGDLRSRRLSGTLTYLTQATYGKLLLPALCPAPSFLYLDSDLVAQIDIGPLLRLPLDGALIAGVEEHGPAAAQWGARLGVERADPYVNAGVLLIDAQRWRQLEITRQAWDWHWRLGERAQFLDQDLINTIAIGRKKTLPEVWNTMQHEVAARGRIEAFDGAGFAGIFHFTALPKPWQADAPASMRALYETYAQAAPLRL